MSNVISIINAEVASLKVATAKNGNKYISGIIVDRNEDGQFVYSESFRSFTITDLIPFPKLDEFSKLTPEQQKSAKGNRPHVTIVGRVRKNRNAEGLWQTVVLVDSITE